MICCAASRCTSRLLASRWTTICLLLRLKFLHFSRHYVRGNSTEVEQDSGGAQARGKRRQEAFAKGHLAYTSGVCGDGNLHSTMETRGPPRETSDPQREIREPPSEIRGLPRETKGPPMKVCLKAVFVQYSQIKSRSNPFKV